MRLFIAISLPNKLKQRLKQLQEDFKTVGSGRFVPSDNMHITLAFLGETNDLVGAVNSVINCCQGFPRYSLLLGGANYFVRDNGKTLFSEVSGDISILQRQHESLNSALRENGFKTDYKRFTPHITLCRNFTENDSSLFDKLFLLSQPKLVIPVNEIVLFESKRTRDNMEYLPLHREKLY